MWDVDEQTLKDIRSNHHHRSGIICSCLLKPFTLFSPELAQGLTLVVRRSDWRGLAQVFHV